MSAPVPATSLGGSVELALLQSMPQAQIILSGLRDTDGNTARTVGFVTSNITIGGSNCFQSPFDTALMSALTLVANGGGILSNELLGTKIAQIRLSTQTMTRQVWTKSESPIFRATMVFLAIKEADDVRTPVKAILSSVFPEFDNSSPIMKAPLGYDGVGAGLLTVVIGKWFQAPNMIMRSANFSFSKEIIASGAPLYAEGNIEFIPYDMTSGSTIAGYIGG
jgi:hypothetical protein